MTEIWEVLKFFWRRKDCDCLNWQPHAWARGNSRGMFWGREDSLSGGPYMSMPHPAAIHPRGCWDISVPTRSSGPLDFAVPGATALSLNTVISSLFCVFCIVGGCFEYGAARSWRTRVWKYVRHPPAKWSPECGLHCKYRPNKCQGKATKALNGHGREISLCPVTLLRPWCMVTALDPRWYENIEQGYVTATNKT